MNDVVAAPLMQKPSREDEQRHIKTVAVIERAPAERPAHDTIEAIVEWLIGPAVQSGSGALAADELAWRMLAAGLPLLRMTLHSSALHPQFLGTSFIWWRDTGQTVQSMITHEVRDNLMFVNNPISRVVDDGETLRRRVDADASGDDFTILPDLRERGATDYLALPVPGAHGRRYAFTVTTDRPGGFTAREIEDITLISRRMQSMCDAFSQRAITQTLLNAYLGANAGPKVLAGQIRRGTGEEMTVVLWSSDLRGFTERSDRLAGSRMVEILNALFDAQATAIHKHGGEILKFIGDGLLAIFPIGDGGAGDATCNALAAATEALDAVHGLSDDPAMAGEPPLKIVVALHAGTVIYGNVGAANRLDFTVIGPAVNLVSRAEAIAKSLNLPIVVSDDFARAYGKPLRSLGSHQLRGLAVPHELFAPV